MKKKNVIWTLGMGVILAMPLSGQATGMVSINMCYQDAGEDPEKISACLDKELKLVQAEHKDVTERVTVIAKAWDKPNCNRVRWEKLMRSNQAFDNYMKRECDFVKSTTKGNARHETNAQLACRINLYRMRTDMLENRFLSSARE